MSGAHSNLTRQTVITGVGIISPIGTGLEATATSLRQGRGGIAALRAFEAAGFPIQCAGEVSDPSLPRGQARQEAMAGRALAEAMMMAGLAGDAELTPDPRRALSFAVGKPPLDLEALWQSRALWAEAPTPENVLRSVPQLESDRAYFDPGAVLRRLAAASGAGGPAYSSYTACASGNDALGLGKRLIERGQADMVVAGATDSQVFPLSLLEFELLSALSHLPAATACRPFDRDRTGFVVGEGAAVVILEEAGAARRRGVPVLAELAGYGSSLDSYGLTKCHPQGRGAAQAMRAALQDAGLAPNEVDYLNAHGTGTVLNDLAEAAAVQQLWADDVRRLPVSSTKAMTGHLLTAASAVEAVITLLCLRDGILPVNLNFEHPDPECRLNIVRDVPGAARLRVAASNGFGFGGQNSTLILRRAA